MPTTRLILASLLIAAPMLCAQQAQTRQAQPPDAEVKAAPTRSAALSSRPSQPLFEPLRLTIIFRKIRHGEPSTQKTYTIAASSRQADPQIRDDNRVPFRKESSDVASPPDYLDENTDVDVQNIRKVNDLVSLTLRVSSDGHSLPSGTQRTRANSTLTTHRYTVSPTVPMGKLTTIYSLEDGITNVRVEVLLLVEPLNEK
jgi:hypothetical protein